MTTTPIQSKPGKSKPGKSKPAKSKPGIGFKVQAKLCTTCIYRKDSPLSIAKLEADIADNHGGFTGYRVCHHSKDVCCRGFWNRHRDKFALGQIAQRLRMVRFVTVDIRLLPKRLGRMDCK